MPKACSLLLLTFVLWPSPARAQPLFHTEHYWTVTVSNQSYGLRQILQDPGDFRWTEVWLGRCAVNIDCRAVEVIALALRSPANLPLRINWRSFRRLP